jgi:hypothetical protein
VIAEGHRLRLTVTPADFPHQVPPLPQLAGQLGGVDTVLTDPEHASYVELPRIGRRAGGRLPLPRLLRGDGR